MNKAHEVLQAWVDERNEQYDGAPVNISAASGVYDPAPGLTLVEAYHPVWHGSWTVTYRCTYRHDESGTYVTALSDVGATESQKDIEQDLVLFDSEPYQTVAYRRLG